VLKARLIACLDVAGDVVVKGTRFGDLVDLGDPAELARAYEDQGADEVVMLDITASVEGRPPRFALIERVARSLSIPLTVGGGIPDADVLGRVLASGADKASVNSPAVAHPDLVAEASARYGSQAVVVAVDVRREDGDWIVYTHGGRRRTAWRLAPWLRRVEELGAGEILLTSIDRDGTGTGYDLEALAAAGRTVRLPIIASGGGARPEQLGAALRVPGVTGALVAGVLHRRETTLGALKAGVAREGVPIRVGV
jgi:cyclase